MSLSFYDLAPPIDCPLPDFDCGDCKENKPVSSIIDSDCDVDFRAYYGRWYLVTNNRYTFSEAVDICDSVNAQPAIVITQDDILAVMKQGTMRK